MAQKQKNKQAKNVMTALVLLVILLVVAVASWLYLSGLTASMQTPSGYQNVTFTDAVIKCESFSQKRYGEKLKRMTFDSHSSRWEQRSGQYKVFFKAVMSGGGAGAVPAEYWVMCDVSGQSGRIRDFDVLEDKALKTEAQRADSGGMFGWP